MLELARYAAASRFLATNERAQASLSRAVGQTVDLVAQRVEVGRRVLSCGPASVTSNRALCLLLECVVKPWMPGLIYIYMGSAWRPLTCPCLKRDVLDVAAAAARALQRKMSRHSSRTSTTTAAPLPVAAAASSATESSGARGKSPQSLTEDEIDERLWHGAAAQGWTVLPRGDIEAARRNGSWMHVSPDGTKHRRRADAVEAHHADVDRRLWVGAAEQGWQVQPYAAPPW